MIKFNYHFLLNLSIFIVIIALLNLMPSYFYTSNNLSHIIHRTATISILVCGFIFLLSIGNIDFSAGPCLIFIMSILRMADSNWEWSIFSVILMAFAISLPISFWHYFWIEKFKVPSSFITGITGIIFLSFEKDIFFQIESATPHNSFFYILSFNNLSDIAIYTLVISLVFGFFLLYYLHLSNRLQHNLKTEQWIPFLILIILGVAFGVAGFIRFHHYIQFRLSFFIAILTISSFFLMEKFSRLGRQIEIIGYDPKVAYLAGIPVVKVKKFLWILMGFLIGLTSLFFRDTESILFSYQTKRIEGIILAGGILGFALGAKRKTRIIQSFIIVLFLVFLETIFDFCDLNDYIICAVNIIFILLGLSLSRFKEGKVT